MLKISKAQKLLFDIIVSVGTEEISLTDSPGRVLAEPINAQFDSPVFSNSAMDGFAVIAKDVFSAGREIPITLQVIADIPAGRSIETILEIGQSMRIMTGAPLPRGADAVVPVENTDSYGLNETNTTLPTEVKIFGSVFPGANVRKKGEDFKMGNVLLSKGRILKPQDVGILAMMGKVNVQVHRRPRIGLMSTGDELLPPESELLPGKIRETNSHMLSSLVVSCGGKVISMGIVPDDEKEIYQALDALAESGVDLILSSAGVSVGVYDFVKKVVEENGHIDFWRVNMRPGKPLAVGAFKNIPFVGLPGNPVSSFVGFEVFLRPAIYNLAGSINWQRNVTRAKLLESIESDGRESYLRAILEVSDGQLNARLTGHQGSGNLFSLVYANCLIIVPPGVKSLQIGSEVEVWPFYS